MTKLVKLYSHYTFLSIYDDNAAAKIEITLSYIQMTTKIIQNFISYFFFRLYTGLSVI